VTRLAERDEVLEGVCVDGIPERSDGNDVMDL